MNFETVTGGFHLEGMYPDGDEVWFSDVFDGGVRRWSADGRVDVWLPDRRLIGGILRNGDGKVLFSGFGGIAWLDPVSGASGMLIDAIDGEPIPGVNEMIPDRHGGLYFGVDDLPSLEKWAEMTPGGLHHLDVTGRVTLVQANVRFPNGIGLSADGRRLYSNQTYVGTFAQDLTPEGGPAGEPRLLIQKEDCDGLAIDAEGCIWVTGYDTQALLRLAPDGSLLERISTPSGVSNVRFGGADGRDLYITAASAEVMAEFQSGRPLTSRGSRLMRGRAGVAGLPIPRTAFTLG